MVVLRSSVCLSYEKGSMFLVNQTKRKHVTNVLSEDVSMFPYTNITYTIKWKVWWKLHLIGIKNQIQVHNTNRGRIYRKIGALHVPIPTHVSHQMIFVLLPPISIQKVEECTGYLSSKITHHTYIFLHSSFLHPSITIKPPSTLISSFASIPCSFYNTYLLYS